MLDLILRGGTVVDGTGAPRRVADVGIRDGRIATIGSVDDAARETRDVTGLVVAPGFVDLHTHYDAQVSWDPWATPSCFHGVTTVIGGNCGFTVAPTSEHDSDYLLELLARVEGMPIAALREGLRWDWRTFGEWLAKLDGALGVNAGFLVGHSTLRRVVMGADAVGEAASAAHVDAMRLALRDALAGGALGLSTSQSNTHNDGNGEPVPSRAATPDELIALASVVGEFPGTTLEVILAGCMSQLDRAETELMTRMSLAGDRPVNWNVLTVNSRRPHAHRHQLESSDFAAEHGATVKALALPNLMQVWCTFATGFALDGFPGWASLFTLPPAERIAALQRPEVREDLRRGAASPEAGVLGDMAEWAELRIAETFAAENDGLAGRRMRDIAAERGGDPFDVMLDIVVADELRTGLLPTPAGGNDDEGWRLRAETWTDPRTIVGGSDAGAHLDMICGGIYSTHLLGDGVRERELLSLEAAVHELADVPARVYGLRDRGRLAAGWFADIVVFDPDAVAPGPVHMRDDLPSGAPRLFSEGIGVEHVLVNGVPIVADGALTGRLPGTVIRPGRDTDTVTAGQLGRIPNR